MSKQKKNTEKKEQTRLAVPTKVWGLAAGKGSTNEAARGALCIRDYEAEIPAGDWLEIITIQPRR